MKLHHFVDVMMIMTYLSYIPIAFSSLPSISAISAATEQEENAMAKPNRHLQETPVTPPLKCKNSDSKLQLELETVGGSTIPFYCDWAKKGNYACSGTGALSSHCPATCKSCSRYRCADSEGRFIWKGEARTCDWLAAKSTRSKKKLCRKKPELATTCRATCSVCGDTKTDWEQVGQDLVGEAFNDASGYSMSLSADGSTVAIGALGNDDGGYYAGHVRVHRQNVTSEEWEQIGQDIDGENDGDYSGGRVSISADGDIVAIAAPGIDGTNATNVGHVRVFKYDASYSNGRWVQMGQDIDGDRNNGISGTGLSLSADGTTVGIGAPETLNQRGHTRVYKYDVATGQWEQKGQDIEGEGYYDFSGESVSISSDGNRVAIGASGSDGDTYYPGKDLGHVRIYLYIDSSDRWEQLGQDIDGESSCDVSGVSVSLSADGRKVAIGAPQNSNDSGQLSGHVRIHEYTDKSGQWEQIGQDIDGESNYDASGRSVSISADGSRVAIGASGNSNDNGNYSGHARIYEYNNSGQWEQIGKDLDGQGYNDSSGESVSISADGNTVAVGAPEYTGEGNGNGYVRIFHQAV